MADPIDHGAGINLDPCRKSSGTRRAQMLFLSRTQGPGVGADWDARVASEIPEILVRPWRPIGKLGLVPLILELCLVNVKFGAEGY